MKTILRKRNRRGNSAVEFALIMMPLTAVLLGIFEVGRFAWTYQTMAMAVKSAARAFSVRGAKCSAVSPACPQPVRKLVEAVRYSGVGLDESRLALSLSAGSSSKSCFPSTACASDNSAWPPSPHNAVGMILTVKASYPVFPLSWLMSNPPTGLVLTSSAREVIQF